MTLVRWNTALSLDGFMAGPDDAMDWVFAHDEPDNPIVGEIIESTGALLVGRRTYDAGQKAGQPEQATEAFGGAWHGPQFVLTHRPAEPTPGSPSCPATSAGPWPPPGPPPKHRALPIREDF